MKIALPMLCMLMCIATAFKPALTSHQHTPSARRRLSHLHSTPVTQSPRVGARSPEPPVCPPFVFEADTAKLANKPVYAFDKQALGAGAAFDRAGAKALLGGKGANLADMAKVILHIFTDAETEYNQIQPTTHATRRSACPCLPASPSPLKSAQRISRPTALCPQAPGQPS